MPEEKKQSNKGASPKEKTHVISEKSISKPVSASNSVSPDKNKPSNPKKASLAPSVHSLSSASGKAAPKATSIKSKLSDLPGPSILHQAAEKSKNRKLEEPNSPSYQVQRGLSSVSKSPSPDRPRARSRSNSLSRADSPLRLDNPGLGALSGSMPSSAKPRNRRSSVDSDTSKPPKPPVEKEVTEKKEEEKEKNILGRESLRTQAKSPPKPKPTKSFSMRESLRIAAQEITQLRSVLSKNNIVVPRSRLVAADVKQLLSQPEPASTLAKPPTILEEEKSNEKENVPAANTKKETPVDKKTEEAFLREQARLENELSMVKGVLLMQNMRVNTTVTQDEQGLSKLDICGDAKSLHYLMDVKQKLGLLKAQHQLLRSDMLCLANEMNTSRQWVEQCFGEAIELQKDAVDGLQARLERLAKLLP